MDNVFNILETNEIKLVSIELENNGYYDPPLKIIFINQNIDERKQKEVILHELGHALNHKEYSPLYSNLTFRFKMENEAYSFMMI